LVISFFVIAPEDAGTNKPRSGVAIQKPQTKALL